ncbi:hypothetical protein N7523_003456 [Penicillium sp. IBT 18751x]|nr:hypothetical protein N7523_003456 [Penicillium sp. IBT 18751x]
MKVDLLAATVIFRRLKEYDDEAVDFSREDDPPRRVGFDIQATPLGLSFHESPPPSLTETLSLRQAACWSGLR